MAPDLDCLSPTHEMKGYLRKSKKWSKRYFVLKEGPPPRLECYDSAKSYMKNGKPKRCIELENAWNIDKKVTAKHKHLIGVYTEEEYFAMAAENDSTQEMWVNALQKAVLGYKGHMNRTHIMYKHIWQGNVDTRDLENCSNDTRINLQGTHRCCLTDKTMVFICINGSGASDLYRHKPVEINISNIRSCGHKDNLFFMESGRYSGIGTGKLWMELDDATIADNMHRTILQFMITSGQDDARPRSYSSGSGSGRSVNRSRHYYNPPPSQVGMGKPPTTTTAISRPVPSIGGRDRCESFPATQASTLTDEARYRTSSEGETTMKRHHPFHMIRRKAGSVSPNTRARVYSHGKRPLFQQSLLHTRTASLPGSNYSSSNSSMEHLSNHDYSRNGQSPAMSEEHGSSDEFSSSPMTNQRCQGSLHHSLYTQSPHFDHFSHFEWAPPPPTVPPESSPLVSEAGASSPRVLSSDYAVMQSSHSRSHSLDDNLSCGTAASSLSTSPQAPTHIPGVSISPDACYQYSQSPSQSSSHSHCGDFNLLYTPTSASPADADGCPYAFMNPDDSDTYPHETSPLSSDYTPMTPGRGAASSTPTEDKSGYVPMRPLVRSQPQDIGGSVRRRSLSDNRLVNGSYSPASPLSRSPDKSNHVARSLASATACSKCKRNDLPHSYPCQHCTQITVAVSRPSIPSVSCHGLKVDAKNDFSMVSSKMAVKHLEQPPVNYSDDYASMGSLTTTIAAVQIRSSPQDVVSKQQNSPKDFNLAEGTDIDHEYLPMSPMNAANPKKSIVWNVLSIAAESVHKPTSNSSNLSSGGKYPHQQTTPKSGQYSTHSLDRRDSKARRRTISHFTSGLVTSQRHAAPRTSTKARKHHSLRISTDTKSSSVSEASSNNLQPPLSPVGGEYVSINYDKARKQVGPTYLSLTDGGASGEPEDKSSELTHTQCNRRSPVATKATHDSNRNLLPTKQSPPKDDYLLLKPGELTT
ncbi:insulin receptor substrate 2-B-like [Styela clava]